MRFSSLDGWLSWQETLHPNEIELGLERVAAVARGLGLLPAPFLAITVGGTSNVAHSTPVNDRNSSPSSNPLRAPHAFVSRMSTRVTQLKRSRFKAFG